MVIWSRTFAHSYGDLTLGGAEFEELTHTPRNVGLMLAQHRLWVVVQCCDDVVFMNNFPALRDNIVPRS